MKSISAILIVVTTPLFIFSSPQGYAQTKTIHDTLNIYFDFNKYAVDKSAGSIIHSIFTSFEEKAIMADTVYLFGYTDTVGSAAYNLLLSQKRCNTIDSILRTMPVVGNPTILKSFAMGESFATGVSDRLDRKVSIVFKRLDNNQTNKTVPHPETTEIDTVIVLDNVYFKPDLPIIDGQSFSTLNNYLYIIQKYPDRFIEVRGHVNHTDSELKPGDPLFILSEKRAKVIYEFFLDRGVKKELMNYKGYGNAHLLYKKPQNLDEKLKNMRVELVIHKMVN